MRRKRGVLLPIEISILGAIVELQTQRDGGAHGFLVAKRIHDREGAPEAFPQPPGAPASRPQLAGRPGFPRIRESAKSGLCQFLSLVPDMSNAGNGYSYLWSRS